MCLLEQNLSFRQIKALFNGLGTSRVQRIAALAKNPDKVQKVLPPPSHAATKEDIQRIKEHQLKFETEVPLFPQEAEEVLH